MKKQNTNQRVVITGAGSVCPLGNDWASIRQQLRSLTNCVQTMDQWNVYDELNTRLAAPIVDFQIPEHYPKRKIRSQGRVAQLAVRATELALESAGLLNDPRLQDGQTGIAYGSATGSSEGAMEFFSLLEDQSMARMTSTTYLRMMSHTAAVNISVFFGTTGRMYTTSSACTAGSQGIGYAYEAIRSGQQTIMIAGGAEELCPTQAAVFDVVYATSTHNNQPKEFPRPFDTDRDGLVLGEGACTLILESLDSAEARGAKILAEVIGFATNTDGAHIVKPQQSTMEVVMHQALKDADLSADAIGYISAHGTATKHGDIAESQATEKVMGSNTAFSSLKSYIGHSLGACGAIEAWVSIMMMNEGWFAPTLNLDNIDPACGQLDYIRDSVREIKTDYIMSNNFAFGGINTSLIFKRFH
ncbi:MAG: 3-oxoacyl-[acyl-carrier-protein] synthase II [Kiritimatiellia bacterium]|jgi:3-oxoacyl-[acyl-carrier-protein] synthase II